MLTVAAGVVVVVVVVEEVLEDSALEEELSSPQAVQTVSAITAAKVAANSFLDLIMIGYLFLILYIRVCAIAYICNSDITQHHTIYGTLFLKKSQVVNRTKIKGNYRAEFVDLYELQLRYDLFCHISANYADVSEKEIAFCIQMVKKWEIVTSNDTYSYTESFFRFGIYKSAEMCYNKAINHCAFWKYASACVECHTFACVRCIYLYYKYAWQATVSALKKGAFYEKRHSYV